MLGIGIDTFLYIPMLLLILLSDSQSIPLSIPDHFSAWKKIQVFILSTLLFHHLHCLSMTLHAEENMRR